MAFEAFFLGPHRYPSTELTTADFGCSGKTTLMDVLAGRKTRGYIEGDILISGYPKQQATFARISGYCEQNDIHSPNVTVFESLVYSAWMRLAPEVDKNTRMVITPFFGCYSSAAVEIWKAPILPLKCLVWSDV